MIRAQGSYFSFLFQLTTVRDYSCLSNVKGLVAKILLMSSMAYEET